MALLCRLLFALYFFHLISICRHRRRLFPPILLKKRPTPTDSPLGVQVRYLTQAITPAQYDFAAMQWPELCPLRYLGDRRSGHELLAQFEADAADAAAVAGDAVGDERGGSSGGSARIAEMTEVVRELAAFLATSRGAALTQDEWYAAIKRAALNR